MSITRSGGPPSGDEVQRVGGRAAYADRERAAVGERVLTPQILKLAAVVVLGSIMTILDMTIVNVGLATLGRDLQTSIATLQWVSTAYLLAFASVIPLTGWASERFGVRPLWLASLAGFMLGSLLAGLSWSIGALIAFRVVQGLGGGMIMPLGQTILAQAAGPQRMGRVMSIVGVPMLLAPIFGLVIGGAIVGAASWRWMFFINLPVGGLALLLAVRLLPVVPRRPPERLDVRGLALLCGGIAIFIYGLAEIARQSTFTGALPPSMLLAGLTLVALFVWHALRIADPLIDVRLFAQRGFATAAATNFILGVALFGVALLLPLYFQIVRGTSPLQTGLLMIPQGLGAACAITLAGRLTDKLGARRRPGRNPDRPGRYRRLHPDRRSHPLLVPRGSPVHGRRGAGCHHHPLDGSRLPAPRTRCGAAGHQRAQRCPACRWLGGNRSTRGRAAGHDQLPTTRPGRCARCPPTSRGHHPARRRLRKHLLGRLRAHRHGTPAGTTSA